MSRTVWLLLQIDYMRWRFLWRRNNRCNTLHWQVYIKACVNKKATQGGPKKCPWSFLCICMLSFSIMHFILIVVLWGIALFWYGNLLFTEVACRFMMPRWFAVIDSGYNTEQERTTRTLTNSIFLCCTTAWKENSMPCVRKTTQSNLYIGAKVNFKSGIKPF